MNIHANLMSARRAVKSMHATFHKASLPSAKEGKVNTFPGVELAPVSALLNIKEAINIK